MKNEKKWADDFLLNENKYIFANGSKICSMIKDYKNIVDDITSHLSKSGRQYFSDFYIGITNDVQRRMFEEHNVQKERTWWIYRTATDSDTARKVETYFLKKGMRGDTVGGNDDSKIVYCYAVGPTTIE